MDIDTSTSLVPPQPQAPENRQDTTALDDIKLQIGDTLQLQPQHEASAERYYVKLIGYLKNAGVIVSTPSADGKLLFVREGQNFVVRAFCGKSAFAFPTTVIKAASVPYAHLHLSYPRRVRGIVVRKGARVNTRIIAAVTMTEGIKEGDNAAATIVNLSTTGAMLNSRTWLGGKGDRLIAKFRLMLSGIESYLAVVSVIRNVQEDDPGTGEPPQYNHGIEFLEIQPPDFIMLTAYVYQQLLEDAPDA